jgi:hypothetical protein
LTTKDQGVIFERTMKPTRHHQPHPQKGTTNSTRTDPGSYSWKLLLIKDARVHYVVLKQQPHTTHPTHFTCVLDAARKPETQVPGSPPVLLPQDPTVCQTLNRPSPPPHRSRQPGPTPKGRTGHRTG